ncbi:pilus assembly protein N-terminal domain-containing protein, partial [Bacillus siamensis]|nr:pilus assembly protein N-terminal domain-containing protein [Bacillus siamensis]
QLTKRTTLVRSLSISAVTALMLIPALASATDPDKNADVAVTSSIAAKTRSVSLGVGKSVVVDLPREAKDVLVADPKIA